MENTKHSFFNNLKKYKASFKIKMLFVALICVVIFCIFLSSFQETKSDKTNTVVVPQSDNLYLKYLNETEARLSTILSQVKGLDNVKVFLNISQSPKITYLSENKNSSTTASNPLTLNTIVLAKDGTLTYPIVVLEELPEILGVLIVAKGASDAKIKLEIVNIVSGVLKVDVSAVEVLEGK